MQELDPLTSEDDKRSGSGGGNNQFAGTNPHTHTAVDSKIRQVRTEQPISSIRLSAEVEEVLLDTRAAARWLGYAANTLEHMRVRGEGPPFVKCGGGRRGRVRYRPAAIRAWLAEREMGGDAA